MAVLGYARVSTAEQDLEPQRCALLAAGCGEVIMETGSGADRGRPELSRLLARIGPGDTLIVVRIDRLARSLAHLLEVIDRLEAKGAKFRSLGDPIDTSGPSGTLILQILGAVAEFERALIRERTLAGLAAARAKGRVGGNPGLKARNPVVLAELAAARRAARLAALLPEAEQMIGWVRRLRPAASWREVAGRVNAVRSAGSAMVTPARLSRLARLFVAEGLLDAGVLTKAPKSAGKSRAGGGGGQAGRLAVAAAYLRGRPDASLAELGAQLLRLDVRPPRGGAAWAPSSLKALRDRARRAGLLQTASSPP